MEKRTKLEEFLQYKALSVKFSLMNDSLREIGFQSLNDNPSVKNVCAKMPISLVNELEQVVHDLNCSKRQFVEYAIVEAIEKAKSVLDYTDVAEGIAESYLDGEKK
jgi:hypothetical protein